MKKYILRTLSWLLVLASLGSMSPLVYADGLYPGQILVNYYGERERRAVMTDSDGTVYVPLSWITYYADLDMQEKDDYYVYYFKDQQKERNFAKRIFIEPETHTFAVGIYFTKKSLTPTKRIYDHYYPLFQGEFSAWVEENGEIWVPITELLPLMDVEASFDDDGVLYMQPVVNTLFRVLYEHEADIDDLLFNAEEDVVGNDFITVGGYTIGTALDFRIDRLDVVFNSGRINDYEEIFKDYLMDDAAYLNAFENDSDLYGEYLSEVAEGKEEVGTVFGIIKTATDKEGPLFWLYKYVSERNMQGVGALETYSEAVQWIISGFVYADIYFNHVDDHMEMLDAVYTYEKSMKGKPSYKAAMNVIKIYDPDADSSKELVYEGVRDLVRQITEGELKKSTMKTLGPWYAAIEISKLFCYEEMKYVSDCGLMGMVDNTVQYSHQVYAKRLKSGKFSQEQVDDIRLCLIMSLVASRHAYGTYWKTGKEDDIEAIAEILEDLYKAGVFREYDNTDTYKNLKKKYASMVSKLEVYSNNAVQVAELALLAAAFEEQQMFYDGFGWAVADTDGDHIDEFTIQYYTTDSAYETYVAEFDLNDFWITAGIFLTEEYKPDLRFSNVNMTRHVIAGDPDAIIGQLDDYLMKRDGFLFRETADVDNDGDMDVIYCLYGVKQRWQQLNTDVYLNLYDPHLTTLVVETGKTAVHIQTNSLQGLSLEVPEGGDLSLLLDSLPYSVDGQCLNIDGYPYRYKRYQGYQFGNSTGQFDADCSVANFLAGEFSGMLYAGYGLEYNDPNDPYLATVDLDGENITIRFMDDGVTVEWLRVEHQSGSLKLAGDLYTDMTIHELWDRLPDSSAMMLPYPIYSNDGILRYETMFYWKNSVNGEIYEVTLGLPVEGVDVLFYNFRLIEDGSDDLI